GDEWLYRGVKFCPMHKDNFTKLNRKDDKLTAVIIENPGSTDTENSNSYLRDILGKDMYYPFTRL
ncbi:hypothetical protein Tco_0643934, partial [Tanacetum coccineum]